MSTRKKKASAFNAIKVLIIPFRLISSLIINSCNNGNTYILHALQKKSQKDKLRLQKEIEAIQQQMINKQLNTHFALKAEDSISERILISERIEAYDLVNSFSNLMRAGVLFSNSINWALKEELAFTKNYLDLMKIRYSTLFDFKMHIKKPVDCKNLLVPRLLIQNCTESVIKKAFDQEKTKRYMEINCSQSTEAVEITNTINLGATYRQEKRPTRFLDKNSKCMQLNTKQIDAYNKLYNTDISLEAIDTINTKGESIIQVKLIIPYTY